MMPAVVVQTVAAEMKKYVVIYVQEKKEKGGIAAVDILWVNIRENFP